MDYKLLADKANVKQLELYVKESGSPFWQLVQTIESEDFPFVLTPAENADAYKLIGVTADGKKTDEYGLGLDGKAPMFDNFICVLPLEIPPIADGIPDVPDEVVSGEPVEVISVENSDEISESNTVTFDEDPSVSETSEETTETETESEEVAETTEE